MRITLILLFAVLPLVSAGDSVFGGDRPVETGPESMVFARRGTVDLKLYVFSPRGTNTGARRSAIVLFYGGGWVAGEPAWAFGRAQHFAERGMVAIAAQYRLT
jgi:acetyl esterase/lipase